MKEKVKKLLYIENVASIDATSFYIAAAKAARNCGIEFHLAYNAFDRNEEKIKKIFDEYGVIFHQVDFIRTPYDLRNIKAYKEICEIINREGIEYIHCNTPIGGVVGRIAGKRCHCKKVIYQAHGFHFYKGAPVVNWIIYYPIEIFLGRITDVLITINKEDYERASKLRIRKNGKKYYVPGVGIELGNYFENDKEKDGAEVTTDTPQTKTVIISMGDLVKRKNYSLAIRTIAKIGDNRLEYLICGDGPEKENLISLANKLGVKKNIHFLGYRNDIALLLSKADIFLLSSLQEGFPRSMMEAMACGLPCVATDVRGNSDLIENESNGFLCKPSSTEMANGIKRLMNDKKLCAQIRKNNFSDIRKYSVETIIQEMESIYCEHINNGC